MDSNNVTEKSPGANTGEQQAKAVSYQPPQRPKHLSIDPKAEASGENDPAAKAIERGARRIRIMRIIQSTFGAALSVAIAGFQGRVFALFQSSKSVTGAWPDNPNLMPTLLLLAVASLALIFDLSMLLAYLKPNHRMARVAFTVATASHYIITSAKTVSYAIGAIVARTSYNYGNSSGQTADLWSWSCTDQAAAMQNVNQAPSNCDTQTASWAFALAQLFVESIGWVVAIMVFFQQRREQPDKTAEGRNAQMEDWSGGVDGQVSNLEPKYDVNIGGINA